MRYSFKKRYIILVAIVLISIVSIIVLKKSTSKISWGMTAYHLNSDGQISQIGDFSLKATVDSPFGTKIQYASSLETTSVTLLNDKYNTLENIPAFNGNLHFKSLYYNKKRSSVEPCIGLLNLEKGYMILRLNGTDGYILATNDPEEPVQNIFSHFQYWIVE